MPAKMDEIMALATKYRIPVIEDAAEALGSIYRGKPVGTLGDIGVFSFNNNKIITAYGGGCLVIKTAELAQKVRFYSTQAREQQPYYEHKEIGYNYALSPLCAAAGLSQLPDLMQNVSNRRNIFEFYKVAFSGREVHFQFENHLNRSNRWFSVFLFRDESTQRHVDAALTAEGIETRPVWKPMHLQAAFEGCTVFGNRLSEDYFRRGLCLPSSSWMAEESQKIVVNLINKALGYN
jgi:UDP-N-acetylbacillosamine transaminase